MSLTCILFRTKKNSHCSKHIDTKLHIIVVTSLTRSNIAYTVDGEALKRFYLKNVTEQLLFPEYK